MLGIIDLDGIVVDLLTPWILWLNETFKLDLLRYAHRTYGVDQREDHIRETERIDDQRRRVVNS
jgi:hypothetical protein